MVSAAKWLHVVDVSYWPGAGARAEKNSVVNVKKGCPIGY